MPAIMPIRHTTAHNVDGRSIVLIVVVIIIINCSCASLICVCCLVLVFGEESKAMYASFICLWPSTISLVDSNKPPSCPGTSPWPLRELHGLNASVAQMTGSPASPIQHSPVHAHARTRRCGLGDGLCGVSAHEGPGVGVDCPQISQQLRHRRV
jgi:hypothetical protein